MTATTKGTLTYTRDYTVVLDVGDDSHPIHCVKATHAEEAVKLAGEAWVIAAGLESQDWTITPIAVFLGARECVGADGEYWEPAAL